MLETYHYHPIYKPGKPTSSPSFFRPISLTSCISKFFERLILSRLTFHLESNHLLSTCQAGFRPGRSPLTKFCLNQSGTASKGNNLQTERTILASVDFSKAFDSVWHCALFTNSSRSNSHLASFFWCAPSFLIVELKSRLVVPTAALSASDVGSPRAQYLVRSSSFCLLMTSLRIYFGVPMPPCMLTIWPSGPPPRPAQSLLCCPILPRLETWSNLWRLPLNPKKCESFFFSTDPHQATFQPRLNLLGFPLLFNPTPKFLGVTFDRTLSFGAHVQSLCFKFYPRHKALRSIATASWGPTKESLSLLYKAFVRPVLTYASPGWFPFLCNTATNHLEVLHRAACRVITGCLISTPSSLLLLEAQLPPLKLTLEHQTFYSFERALRLPPTSPAFMPWQLRNVPCRL